jgi:hypothetical protein
MTSRFRDKEGRENGKWKMENGRWKMENGRWKMEDGEWKMDKLQKHTMCRRIRTSPHE